MASKVTQPCYALAVLRQFAEETISLLKKLNLYFKDAKARRIKRAVYVPLARLPSADSELRLIGDVVITVCEVVRKTKLKDYVEGASSYILVGDIAIISINSRLQGREKQVAEAIKSIHPRIKAVYGKVGVEGEERVSKLIHLLGEPKTTTYYKEHGLVYEIDIAKVYVNPRLAAEHLRIAEKLNGYVLDMFSGFGGFSLLASKVSRSKLIIANDLNPYAIYYLLRSISLNKSILNTPLIALNLDAKLLSKLIKRGSLDHIIMNLPLESMEFLDVAIQLVKVRGFMHIYLVARDIMEAREKLTSHLSTLGIGMVNIVEAIRVLDYAPKKFIYRFSIITCKMQHNYNAVAES